MSYKKAYHKYSIGDILEYHYENNIPFKLIYDDGREQVVNIISYDNYNLVCQDERGNSFLVFKHSLKRIETKANLEEVIAEVKEEKEEMNL